MPNPKLSKRPGGRPKSTEPLREATMRAKVTEAELIARKAAAKQAGLSFSDWIRKRTEP